MRDSPGVFIAVARNELLSEDPTSIRGDVQVLNDLARCGVDDAAVGSEVLRFRHGRVAERSGSSGAAAFLKTFEMVVPMDALGLMPEAATLGGTGRAEACGDTGPAGGVFCAVRGGLADAVQGGRGRGY